MTITDTAVRRPVLATVLNLLLVAFGLVAYDRLSLREYPDIDAPVVSVRTNYPGASAAVVDNQITEILEDRIAGVEGIRFIASSSQDGRSNITIEFSTDRDIDGAANDIRDRISGALNNLPEEADPPEVQKEDADADVIMWLNLTATNMDVLQLTDFAQRNLVDRFSTLPGAARVRVGGGLEYALRVWLNPEAMTARGITTEDIVSALREENIELPAGQLESTERIFPARITRGYRVPGDFDDLIVRNDGALGIVRLSDVARVEQGAVEDRTLFRGNGEAMVGIGITKQSTANTLEVARAARAMAARLNPTLPDGMTIRQSYDTSVFIQAAIDEVWKTLTIAVALVVVVIFIFLGTWRAMIIPAVTVPVSLIGTFIALLVLGFSVNLLTLLALVLAVGLVVDDSIVMLENIHRRTELGESPLVAAFRGARQVAFAVVATSIVLTAVFVPIAFLTGSLGRLFTEFALTMAAAVFFSTIVALTLSPMLASKLLKTAEDGGNTPLIDSAFQKLARGYRRYLDRALAHPVIGLAAFVVLLGGSVFVFQQLPSEYAPREDRGAFFILINGPEGANFDYMADYAAQVEDRLMPLVDSGEISRLLMRAPRGFSVERFSDAISIIVLNDWASRRSAFEIMDDVRDRLHDLSGVRAIPIMRQGFGRGVNQPVQFVIGGGDYDDLAAWAETLQTAVEERGLPLTGVDFDYKDTQPQLEIDIDRDAATAAGVRVDDIGLTLQTLLGTRRITTVIDRGEEYDVILQGVRGQFMNPQDIGSIHVRSLTSGALIPLSNIVTVREVTGAATLNRYNRVRAVTLSANLEEGASLGPVLDELTALAREVLPPEAVFDYRGQSQDLQESSADIVFIFALGLVVVFLVLAAQFENWRHPLVIMLTVPLAIAGALVGIWLTGGSLNIYSQIGLIMLVGLASKNGILIVEFVNQLRDEGAAFRDAIIEASGIRLRPIVMTGITTAAGGIALLLTSGAGAETRSAIGVVVVFGVLAATLFTLM
ncbi:MAG: efflux RND transporter permease subunit, partial [Oceanococcaceae bacterium]